MKKFADGRNGGKLGRSGRKPGSKGLISKTFEEFARATLEDPEIQAKIRERLLAELAGKKRNPLPALGALASAAVREKPSAAHGASILFIAQITNGRGEVKRFEIAPDAELPAAEVAGRIGVETIQVQKGHLGQPGGTVKALPASIGVEETR